MEWLSLVMKKKNPFADVEKERDVLHFFQRTEASLCEEGISFWRRHTIFIWATFLKKKLIVYKEIKVCPD